MVYGDVPSDMIKSQVFEGRVNIRKTMAHHLMSDTQFDVSDTAKSFQQLFMSLIVRRKAQFKERCIPNYIPVSEVLSRTLKVVKVEIKGGKNKKGKVYMSKTVSPNSFASLRGLTKWESQQLETRWTAFKNSKDEYIKKLNTLFSSWHDDIKNKNVSETTWQKCKSYVYGSISIKFILANYNEAVSRFSMSIRKVCFARCNNYFIAVNQKKDYNEFDNVLKTIDISVKCGDLCGLVLKTHNYDVTTTSLVKSGDLHSKGATSMSIDSGDTSLLEYLGLVVSKN
jgi:hypothetical protein